MSEPKTPEEVTAEQQKLDEMCLAIGRFVFEFSQLEFMIRHALGDALELAADRFDVITSVYDFATLCKVTKAIFTRTVGADEGDRTEIEAILNGCLGLNTEERLIVAHATWFIDESGAGARHVSRSTLEPKIRFSKIEELNRATASAQALKSRLVSFLIRGRPTGRR